MYHGRDGGRLVSTCWIYCISLWFSLWFEATNGAVSCICVIEYYMKCGTRNTVTATMQVQNYK